MNIPSFDALFTSREKLVKTVLDLCKEVKGVQDKVNEMDEEIHSATITSAKLSNEYSSQTWDWPQDSPMVIAFRHTLAVEGTNLNENKIQLVGDNSGPISWDTISFTSATATLDPNLLGDIGWKLMLNGEQYGDWVYFSAE